METPVIYFYADEPLEAQVTVGWKGGSISQWYPRRSSGESPPAIRSASNSPEATAFQRAGGIDFDQPYKGSITWDLTVGAKGDYDQAEVFKGNETISWLHPRIPGTSLLTAGEKSESYLFYRGIGQLESGLTFSIDNDETLQITNTFPHDIPFVMVFQNNHFQVSSQSFTHGIQSQKSLTCALPGLTHHEKNWQAQIYQEMREGLVASGLFEAEAEGMIQTWWRSYFANPSFAGCPRVFWVMPTAQVDELLPLSITPRPDKLTRVLVGRAEILTPSAEEQLLSSSEEANSLPHYDRFSRAYQHRIEQLKATASVTIKNTLSATQEK